MICWACHGEADGRDTEGWLRHEISRSEASRRRTIGGGVELGRMEIVRLAVHWTCSLDCSVTFYEWLLESARLETAKREVDDVDEEPGDVAQD